MPLPEKKDFEEFLGLVVGKEEDTMSKELITEELIAVSEAQKTILT